MPVRGPADIALRHFRAFMAVLESGSVTTASERLCRSPSSVSRSVAILEDGFAVPLLDRAQLVLAPTDPGERVAARCAAIKAELDTCRAVLARDHRASVRGNAALFDMQTDLTHLRALIAVHDFRSVQRAAELLAVSQPAISYSVRLLEADVGIDLFARMRTGMIATPAGLVLAVTARRILAEVTKMAEDVRSCGGDSAGMVRVGALPYSRSVILPDAIRMVLARHPAVSVRTIEGHIESLVTALHGDEVDAVICAQPDRSLLDGIIAETIADDPMGFFVAADHPLAGRAGITLDQLGGYPFILPPAATITRVMLEDFMTRHGPGAPLGRAETSSSSLIRLLLRDTHLVAFRSVREFAQQIPGERIVRLDMATTPPSRTICVLRRRGVRPTRATESFLAAVRAVAGS